MPETISFGDFQKMDIRIAKIESAEMVEDTDKLLKLGVNIGEKEEKRTLVAGIADVYNPDELVGKNIVVLANLEPKAIRGIESKGMLLAADVDGKAVLLTPDKEVEPGAEVR